MRHAATERRAFTLTELLIVIGIIGCKASGARIFGSQPYAFSLVAIISLVLLSSNRVRGSSGILCAAGNGDTIHWSAPNAEPSPVNSMAVSTLRMWGRGVFAIQSTGDKVVGEVTPFAFINRDFLDLNGNGEDTDSLPYHALNYALNGHNRLGLDVWSNGEDGFNDYHPTNASSYGDDIVNWGRR